MDEVTPVSVSEHVFGCIVFITAFWNGAVFLSLLTSGMTQLYILSGQKQQQLAAMQKFLQANGVSKGLSLRVQRNVQFTMLAREKLGSEESKKLVELVSKPLQMELYFEMYAPSLRIHPFFVRFVDVKPHIVQQICHSAMDTHHYCKDDTIFHLGETSTKMRILKSGAMRYNCNAMYVHGAVVPDVWVSEPVLWTTWVHLGLLWASEESSVFEVDAAAFQAVFSKFDMDVATAKGLDIISYAVTFVDGMNTCDEVNDLPSELFSPEHVICRTASGVGFECGGTAAKNFFAAVGRASQGRLSQGRLSSSGAINFSTARTSTRPVVNMEWLTNKGALRQTPVVTLTPI